MSDHFLCVISLSLPISYNNRQTQQLKSLSILKEKEAFQVSGTDATSDEASSPERSFVMP